MREFKLLEKSMFATKELKITLFTSALMLCGLVYAQDNAKTNVYTAIKAGFIIDGTGKEPISNGMILIKNDLIVQVGEAAKIKLPNNAHLVDYSNKTIMPTLISAHSHLGIIKGVNASDTNNTEQNVLRQLKKYAQYGIGAVTSLGRDMEFIYKLRADRNSGKLDSQFAYIITAGQGLGVPDGAPPRLEGFDPVYRPRSKQDIIRYLNVLEAKKPDIVKIWVDDFYGTLSKMKPEIYKTIIYEAHKLGMPVAAHIFYLKDAKQLVKNGINVLEHSVRDKPIDNELVILMKQKGVAIVPTLQLDEAYFVYTENPYWMNTHFFKYSLEPGVWDVLKGKVKTPFYNPKPSEREALQIAMINIKKLHDAGILIGLGADSGAKIERAQGFSEHRELELLVMSGLTPSDAIKIGTLNSAKIMGVENEMGSLESGKKANLLVLNANPLINIQNTQQIYSVWLDGREIAKGPLNRGLKT